MNIELLSSSMCATSSAYSSLILDRATGVVYRVVGAMSIASAVADVAALLDEPCDGIIKSRMKAIHGTEKKYAKAMARPFTPSTHPQQ